VFGDGNGYLKLASVEMENLGTLGRSPQIG
jgi:hypothetical protein